jgi:hypothetical protein
MKHKIPVRKHYKNQIEEKRDMRVRFNHANENSLIKEFLSMDTRKLRNSKLIKKYSKAQKAMGELYDFLNGIKDAKAKGNRPSKKTLGIISE